MKKPTTAKKQRRLQAGKQYRGTSKAFKAMDKASRSRKHSKPAVHAPSLVVQPFSQLAKGQQVWLRQTEQWPRELATVLKPHNELDDIVQVEVRRRAGNGWIPTRHGYAMLEVKASHIEGYTPILPRRTVAVKGKRRQAQAVKDLSVYQVYRDHNGIAYLRVGLTAKGAQFLVNKGFSVECVELDANSTFAHMLAMRPVVGADIQQCAERLLHPLNDQVTISTRAKEEIQKILNNKELEMQATRNVQAVRPGKFAAIQPPAATGKAKAASAKANKQQAAAPARPARSQAAQPATPARGKAAAAASAAPKRAAAANVAAGPRTNGFAGKRIKVLRKNHGAREGTLRQIGMDIIIGSKTTDEAMEKFKKHAGINNSFFAHAVKTGLVEIK